MSASGGLEECPVVQNRAHFLGMAARIMRHVLVDFARSQNYAKRGGAVLDRLGCPGVASLLAWYYLSFKTDETIPQSLDKFWQYVSNPVHSQSFGVLLNPVATCWMGLTTAEMIKPGITFKKM
jgi:hypothetical protein